MRNFVVTVNGKSYEVEVEETNQNNASFSPNVSMPKVEAPKIVSPTPAPAVVTEKTTQPADNNVGKAAPAGAQKINAPMPGTIMDIKVNVGDTISRGDVLCTLEAMKMENEIMAPCDGKIASVNTSKGASVNTGDLLISIE